MTETILVIGGTGMLGQPVVRRLAADGYNVRVMSRNQSKALALFADFSNNHKITAIEGNIDNLQSLKTAIKDCVGIHINLSGGDTEAHGVRQIIKAAQASSPNKKIKRISLISGVTTCQENCWYEGTRAKLQAEEILVASGFDYSIFRCTMFLETLPQWKYLVGDQPTKWHWLAASDYASMVSNAYSNKKAANKIFFVYGPGPPYTLKEAVDNFYIPICDSSRPPIPILSVTDVTTKSKSSSTFISEKIIAKHHWLARVNELGSPKETNQLLGAPSITPSQWCQDYAKRQRAIANIM